MTRLPTGNAPWLVSIPEPCLGRVLGSCREPEPKLCRDCEQFNNQDSSRTLLRSELCCSGCWWRWQFWATFPTCHLLSWGSVILDLHEFPLNTCSSCLPVPITQGEAEKLQGTPQLHGVDTWDQKKMLALLQTSLVEKDCALSTREIQFIYGNKEELPFTSHAFQMLHTLWYPQILDTKVWSQAKFWSILTLWNPLCSGGFISFCSLFLFLFIPLCHP